MSDNSLRVTENNHVYCPWHGELTNTTQADFRAQNPAPCGCTWTWLHRRLLAVPSQTDLDSIVAAADYLSGHDERRSASPAGRNAPGGSW